jgi:hypothetical protein
MLYNERMAENHVSQSELARRLKVTRQAIRAAIKKGLLVKHGDGRAAYIDLNCPQTKAYMKNGSENRHRPPSGKTRKPGSKPKAKDTKSKQPAPGADEPSDSDEADQSLSIFAEKAALERRFKNKQIEKLDLANKARRGELIERSLVEQFVDAMHRIDNGQWKTLDLKIASDVAAEFGIEDDELVRKGAKVIAKEVASILKLVKREQNKFLRSIGGKKLEAQAKLQI